LPSMGQRGAHSPADSGQDPDEAQEQSFHAPIPFF
jgi:hypothetical protein